MPKSVSSKILQDISTGNDHFFDIDDATKINEILSKLLPVTDKTIDRGTIVDPMGSQVILGKNSNGEFTRTSAYDQNLVGGNYFLDASNQNLLSGVNLIKNDDDTLDISGLTLGKEEWVRLRYKVNLRTELDDRRTDPNFKEQFYLTNGKDTILRPATGSTEEYKFGVPAIKLPTVDLTITKEWEGFDENDTLPSVTFNIKKSIDGENWTLVSSETLSSTQNMFMPPYIWEKKISDLPAYDNKGNRYEYSISEVEGEHSDEYTSSINMSHDEHGNYLFTAVNTAKRAQFIVAKRDKDDNAIFIEGAEFTLYRDSDFNYMVDKQTTDPDGYLVFSGLKDGTYYLKETKAPEGFMSIGNKVIIIKVTGQTVEASSDEAGFWEIREGQPDVVVIDVFNKELTDLKMVKVDDKNRPIKADTATFEIYKEGSFNKDSDTGEITIKSGAVPLTTVVTDLTTGSVTTDKIFDAGEYAIVEKEHPSGYIGLTRPILIKLEYDYNSNVYTWSTEVSEDKAYFTQNQYNLYLSIVNKPLVYPDTGGLGGMFYMIGGIFLMGAAYILRRKYNIKII